LEAGGVFLPDRTEDAGEAGRLALGPTLKNLVRFTIELVLLWITELSSGWRRSSFLPPWRLSVESLDTLTLEEVGEPVFFFLEKMNRDSMPFCACRRVAEYGSLASPCGGACRV